MKLVLTCEHGGNDIPKEFQSLFENKNAILNSHRGYDLGALDLFQALKPLADFSKFSTVSRLLVELNRSLHHKNLFSEFTKSFTKAEKDNVLQQFYKPYREAVECEISNLIKQGETVLHLSIHSFTPIWNQEERSVDIGLLFDPRVLQEKQFCKSLKSEILSSEIYKIRFNQPYLGKADGFTSYLRKQFPANYLGIEIEINQKFSKNNAMPNYLKTAFLTVLKTMI
ncbi:N-formylglutamate amidohydrolase [Bizionia myxarmorum]|uniref:N-formylglutamate amidohydrolase n=1 Tax=Bizionia myxarmorum TaxID=291186 RepID=A0A5D0R3Y0_9FLAO|nr:N-formylglutamate amidohydrolase [Bizionia myxarmorum]TYB75759.1 N-formylglutamate amidohydrolase [Bizionia myxarmorum]